MIRFEEPFVKVPKFPGYYWNVEEQQLYSIKIEGVLKPLKLNKAWSPKNVPEGYQLSRRGRSIRYSLRQLQKLSLPAEDEYIDKVG